MDKKTIRDVDVQGKTVLVRVDFNVPLKNGTVADNTRIRAALPTIEYLLGQNSRVVLMSHLGRPEGRRDPKYSLAPVAQELGRLLGRPVKLADDCVGPAVEAMVKAMKPGEVLLLENLRFHAEEEKNDPDFARRLASLGEIYVNDAFGTAHRAHASTEGVARYLPAVAGLLMEKELRALSQILENPARPMAVIIGGAKVSSKLGVLKHLVGRTDKLLIGGGMANTFLMALGKEVGKSLAEPEMVPEAKSVMDQARERNVDLLLPVDVVVANRVDPQARTQVVDVDHVPREWTIVDIGPKTVEAFRSALQDARTIFWNGPMGIFEVPRFAEGTMAVARLLADSQAVTVVGGGESVQALEQASVAERITHVSTGGGATLEYLEGRVLPGVAALMDC